MGAQPLPEPTVAGKKRNRTRVAATAASGRGNGGGDPFTRYLVLWWHLQKMYVGIFENETEATLHAAARNGVVVELIGSDISIGSIEDYWRRDERGRAMPGEWRTSRTIATT